MNNNVLTDREYNSILRFVEAEKEVRFPISRIASDVLLAVFGWPDYVGKKKAKMAIETLERKGEVKCERSGKILKSIRIKIQENPEIPNSHDRVNLADIEDVRPHIHSFKNFKKRPKGRTKKLHEDFSRGDANEAFFHKSCERLVEILTAKFPAKVTHGWGCCQIWQE